jgi:DNA-binding winged helix-turn-helix (wHTH) protein
VTQNSAQKCYGSSVGWYRFGSFELDLDAFVLTQAGQVLPMQPKVFDVLRHLVERRGRLVTKAELLQDLWRNEHVNEGAVAWSVSHIRRALGQQRGDKHPIETVPGRGYRFTAEVTTGSAAPVERSAATAPASHPPSTLVGRARVMSELEQHLREAAAGRGSLCILTGEAGIGKTRCAAELSASAGALRVQTLFGRCPQEPAAPPLWPFAMAFESAAREHPELAARARELMSSIGAGQEALAPDAQSGARFELIARVAALLRELAETRPTLLILDDLHWADASSLSLLAFIAPELRELPLCIVATLRDGGREPGASPDQPLQRLSRYAHTIPLGAFDTTQVAELVQLIGHHRPSEPLADAVRRAAGGIPLFVQEVVRSLVLEHGERALERLSPDAVRLPELARDLLRQRIHRLAQPTIEALSQAAVIGESFDLSMLLALVELEPEVLLERLEPAIAGGQLESDAPHTYRFVHSLFRSVLYDDLPAAERVATHRKLATLLASWPEDERRDGEVARHFYLSLPAGDSAEVMSRARTAGNAAWRVFAFEDAAVYYGWALEAQVFGGEADPRVRATLLLSLAASQRLSGRTGDATRTTKRTIELARQHHMDDVVVAAVRLRRPTVAMSMLPDDLARSALESVLEHLPDATSATRVSALALLSCLPPYDTDLARSKELSSRAEALARELPEREPSFEAMRARLFSLSGPDDIGELLRVVDRMLALDEHGPPSFYRSDALGARFGAHILAGRINDADAALAQMAAGMNERPAPEGQFYLDRLAAQRRFLDGKFDEADRRWKELYGRAVRAGVSYANLFYNTHSVNLILEREGPRAVMDRRLLLGGGSVANLNLSMRANFARVAVESGDVNLARAQLPALGDPSVYPRDGHYLHMLANLAACAAGVGDKPRCEQLLALLSPYAELNTPSPMGYYLGSVAHFLGLLSVALGHTTRAEAHFEHALARNRGMGYRAGVVRTLFVHGQLLAQLGRGDAARELLTASREEARALGMRGAVQDADVALGPL